MHVVWGESDFSVFCPMPPFQNLCFYWQVFSPDQQTINMTPLNAHILTPKINCAPLGWNRQTAPTRTVPSICLYKQQTKQEGFSVHDLPTHSQGNLQTAEETSDAPWELTSFCCPAHCCVTENRRQCGDWSSSEGLTQSCLFPQNCGSGTQHRWKTEEGEWVIMRVLAPSCPHKKRAQPTTMALLPACHVWLFETVIAEFQLGETQTRRKRKDQHKNNRTCAQWIQTKRPPKWKKCSGFTEDQN